MQEYRVGHFLRFEGFVASNDDEALEHARQFVGKYAVELWSGERFVKRLDANLS